MQVWSVGIEGYRSVRRLHFPLKRLNVFIGENGVGLHPDLLPALGRLIAKAAERTQVWVVTHSQVLADALEDASGVRPRRVYEQDGETLIEGISRLGVVDDGDG